LSPKQDALRKLRDLFWRAWITPQTGGPSATQGLSLRTQVHRVRFRDDADRMSMMIARAIPAQAEVIPATCPNTGRSLPTRGVDEAGLKTPASARKGKKSRGGRGGV
jgi:hypothetical protein